MASSRSGTMRIVAVWRWLAVVAATGLGCDEAVARAAAGDAAAPRPLAATVGAKPAFLDKSIREAWDAAGIKPSPQCTDEEFLRRAYLDVLGRIPNIEEASGFLGSREKGKRAKLVEYLLKHEDYAKNFANQWTVTLVGRKRQERMVDKAALTTWLRQQFNDDRPWNEIAYDLITAKGSNKQNGAVNFPLSHLEMGAVPL